LWREFMAELCNITFESFANPIWHFIANLYDFDFQ